MDDTYTLAEDTMSMSTAINKGDKVALVESVWVALADGKVSGVNPDLLRIANMARKYATMDDQTGAESIPDKFRTGEVIKVGNMGEVITVKHGSGDTFTWPKSALIHIGDYLVSSSNMYMPLIEAQDVTATYDLAGGEAMGTTGRAKGAANYGRPDEDFASMRKRRRQARDANKSHSDEIKDKRTWCVVMTATAMGNARQKISMIKGVRKARSAVYYHMTHNRPDDDPSGRYQAHLSASGCRDYGLKECKNIIDELLRQIAISPGGSSTSLVMANANATAIMSRLTLREALVGVRGFWQGALVKPPGFTDNWTEAGNACAYDLYTGSIVRLYPGSDMDADRKFLTMGDIEHEECELSDIRRSSDLKLAREQEASGRDHDAPFWDEAAGR